MLDKADRASPPVESSVGCNSWHDCNTSGPFLGQVLIFEKEDISLCVWALIPRGTFDIDIQRYVSEIVCGKAGLSIQTSFWKGISVLSVCVLWGYYNLFHVKVHVAPTLGARSITSQSLQSANLV
jgi:hypothetical protein